MFLAYATGKGRTLIDRELSGLLPIPIASQLAVGRIDSER
jgi:hypothetical protein